MIIDHINLNALRVFERVFRHQSMTAAAKELHLTQSGVSQHIKQLEEVLETKLFERVKQKIIPTLAAKELFERCSKGFLEIESALGDLKSSDQFFAGTLNIGFPVEFGNSVVLGMMKEVFQKYPKLKFRFHYGFAAQMNAQILNGVIDLAFIDSHPVDPQIYVEEVYKESLHLCLSERYFDLKSTSALEKKDFESWEYISYLPDASILKKWFAHHYKKSKFDLNIRAEVMDVQGVARLIKKGAGVGILPHHFIKYTQRNHEGLQIVNLEAPPLQNSIQMACLSTRLGEPLIRSVKESLLGLLSLK